ncbi:hypothetical protein D3C77_598450 [compost metagenome]
MTIAGEACVADSAMRGRQVIEQHLAAILFVSVFGRVCGDGQQPGFQTGTPLETWQATHHGQPGILHRFIGLTAA